MREIKFRAWDKETNGWLEGVAYTLHTSGRLITLPINIELMQYTGLKDCEGKEIYEGDILRVENMYSDRLVAYVSWDKVIPLYSWMIGETWLLHFSHGEKGPLYPYCDRHNGYEVSIIGNIYENSELLEATA